MLLSRAFARLLLGAACAAVLATAARAADAVVEEAVIVEPSFSWTGFYVGVNAGYSWGDFDNGYEVAPIPIILEDGLSGSLSADADGASGGVQAGFNWQVNSFVFGVEADIQAADIEGSVSGTEDILGLATLGLDTSTEVDWFGTARLRLGFTPTERLLVYGTGGFAFGRTTSTVGLLSDPALVDETATEKTDRTGWAAGAGAEFALNDNWSIKGEYLYTDLGEEDIFSFAEGPLAADLSSDVKFHTIRIGLNYGF